MVMVDNVRKAGEQSCNQHTAMPPKSRPFLPPSRIDCGTPSGNGIFRDGWYLHGKVGCLPCRDILVGAACSRSRRSDTLMPRNSPNMAPRRHGRWATLHTRFVKNTLRREDFWLGHTKNSTGRRIMRGDRRLVLNACEVRTRDHTPIRAREHAGALIGASPSSPPWSVFQYEDAERLFESASAEKTPGIMSIAGYVRSGMEAFCLDSMIRGSCKLTVELAYVVQLLHLIGKPEIFWGFFLIGLCLFEAIVTDKYSAQDNAQICPQTSHPS